MSSLLTSTSFRPFRSAWLGLLLGAALLGGLPASAQTFTPTVVDPNTGGPTEIAGTHTSMAIVNGNPAVAYCNLTDRNLMFARNSAANGSGSWSIVTVDSAGDVGFYASLAVVNGNPAISYWDGTNGDLKYVRATNASGTSWGSPQTLDSAGDVGFWTSLAVVNGNPAISYTGSAGAGLKYVRASDASGTSWGSPQTLSTFSGTYTSLAVVNGNPAISHNHNGALTYVRASDASGTSWGAAQTLDSAGGFVGVGTSLAVVNGNPAISYHAGGNGDLKYVRAANANGTSWNSPRTLDSSGDVGQNNSLTVVNGNPAISYYDKSNGDLKYVWATDVSGTTWGAPQTLDSNGDVGRYTSLAVVDGNPVISYYDTTNGDLKWGMFLPSPEIGITGRFTSITSGDTTPRLSDYTDFGGAATAGGTVVRSFVIENTGTAALSVTAIAAGGDFSVGGITLPASINAGASTTFTVTFDPSANGLRTATLSIANDDSNENPYTFSIQGTGTQPLSFTVNSLGDEPDALPGDGICATSGGLRTLRAAIQEANALPAYHVTIDFGVNGTIILTSNLPDITKSMVISGNGTANTIISGNHLYRSFGSIDAAGLTVTIQNLKAVNGQGETFGGAIDIFSEDGSVTVSNVVLENGNADYGGGIRNSSAALVVKDSIIRNNTSNTVSAGIWSGHEGTLTLVNTALTGNAGPGGAVFNNAGVLNIYGCTIVNNSASNVFAAGVDNNGGTLTIRNSIIADNTGGGLDLDAGTTNSIQNTLVKTGEGITNGVNGNKSGSPALNPDFTLSSLSPCIHAGDNAAIPSGITTDLAGNARIQQGTVDMGAYESPFAGTGPAPAPTVTISLSDTVIGFGDTPTVTFTFSEAVSGFTNTDITSIPNGNLSAVTTANGGLTYTATFTANAGVEDVTNVIAVDQSGFTSIATGLAGVGTSISDNFAIDNIRPTLTSITVSDTALRIGETATVSFNFSEPTSPFVVPVSITTANGTLTGLTFANGGATWNMTLTPTAGITDATNVISINLGTVVDVSLNTGTGTTNSPNYAIDTVRPTVSSIVLADSALTAGETTLVTITFSEAVTGLASAGLTVPNGAIPSVSSGDNGTTWTGTFTPIADINDATNVISVDLTVLTDFSGNAGTGSADSGNFTIDTRAVDYSVTTAAGVLTITDSSGSADTLVLSEPSAGTILFTATGRTFSLNGAASTTSNSGNISLSGITSIVVNAAAGADTINVAAFTTMGGFPGLTINGGPGDDSVTINGNITFAANANLDLDLQNDSVTPGADSISLSNSNLAFTGTGGISLKCSRSIGITGCSVTTVNGPLTIEANQQGVATTGSFIGFHLQSSTVEATGTGAVTVKARGGDGSAGTGIRIINSSNLRGGTSGTLIVEGRGGAATGPGSGTGVSLAPCQISSYGAAVVVTGYGGGSGSTNNHLGVNLGLGATITSGTGAPVTVVGFGGVATGTSQTGVGMFGGTITSGGGDVRVEGAGGAAGFYLGMDLLAGSITTASSGGDITLVADGIDVGAGMSVDAAASGVSVLPRTAGAAINLGGTDAASMLGLTDAELDLVTAGTLNIGDGNNGAITVSAVLSPANYGTLALIGDTTFGAAGGFTADVTSTSAFEKISVTGTVNITAGAALTMASAGGYVWNGTDSFTLLDNDAADAITGTFTGPTLTNFLGSTLPGGQSYGGGTGNDLVFSKPSTSVTSITLQSANPNKNASVTWQIVFADAVDGLSASNFSLVPSGVAGATITSVTETGGPPSTTWNISANTGTGNGTLGLNFVNDSGMTHDVTTTLPFVGEAYTIDKTAPAITSITRQSPLGAPTNADSLVFRVTFSEEVHFVDTADFVASGKTATVTTVAPISGNVYDVTVSGGNLAGLNGTVGLNLNGSAPADFVTDVAGNNLPKTEPGTDDTFALDNIVPTVDMTSVTGNPTTNAAIPVTVQFSEAVVNFIDTDIVPGNAAVTGFTAVDGDTYTFDLVPSGPGVTVTANIAANVAQDGAGNNNTAAADFSRAILDNVSISATTPTAVEGGVNSLYTFTRGGSSGALTVTFQLDAGSTAAASTDFSLSGAAGFDAGTGAGTVEIPDGQLSATVSLTALVETIHAAEAAETVRFNVVAGSGYVVGTPANATVTIAQNGFVVTTTNDSGSGSLRQAVANANSIAGPDTITFSDGTGGTVNFTDGVQDTITLLTGELPTITESITVQGPVSPRVHISGNDASPIFRVLPAAVTVVAIFDRLVLRNGFSTGNGAAIRATGMSEVLLRDCAFLNNVCTSSAGAVLVQGELNVLRCEFSGNSATHGGAIYSDSAYLTVAQSTFVNNTATMQGGAILANNFNPQTVEIIQSSFSGNSANSGGALYVERGNLCSIVQSTFTGNSAANGGGIVPEIGTPVVENTILAGNTATVSGPEALGTFTSNGGNFVGVTTGATGFTSDKTFASTGTVLAQVIGSLADNGGPTLTHALVAGSPALNGGVTGDLPADTFDLDGDTNIAEPIPFDQRGTGFTRAIDTVDIGAVELQKAVSVTALDAAKAEGNGGGTTNYTFTVARTGDLADSVTLDWTVTGSGVNQATAADFAAMSGQVTLNASEASKVVNVVVSADNIVEPAEGFTVTLSNPTNGYVVNGATADGTVNNDDSATLLLTGGTSKNEGNTGTTTYTFTATLSQPVQGGVSVAYTTNDGTATAGDNDYTDNDGSLSFPGSVVNEQRTFDVLVTGDNKVEATEDFTAVLGAVTGGHGAVTVTGSSQTGTITNDDSAVVAVAGNVSQLEGAGPMAFSITLSNPVDINVMVNFATSNGTAIEPGDYTAASGTATFVAGTTTAQVVNVAVANDAEFEGDEIFDFTLSGLSAPSRSVTLGTNAATGTIQNDDTLTISITATDDSADENTAATGTWRVSRNGTLGAVTANLEVDLTSTALAADWTQIGASFVSMAPGGVGTVTIPDGQSFIDIILTPVADLAAEADETVQLNVTAGTGYTPSNSPTRTVTIARNDFGVTNVNDSGEGTLRQAIDNANVLGSNPTITFEGAVFADATADTITLTSGAVPMSVAMTLDGPGVELLTVNGSNADRVFFITDSSSKFIDGLTITGGHAIGSDNNGGGGAIFNLTDSSLTLNRCAITGNTADTFGGGILNFGTLDVLNSTVSGNTANGNQIGGGGIDNAGQLTIINSTLSGNSAPNASEGGGGLANLSPALIVNSTITGNQAGNVAGGIASGNFTVTLRNTIVAGNQNNTTVPDVGGNSGFTSQGHNMIGNAGTAVGLTNGLNGDQVGTGATPINPLLGPLQNNGGSTGTHALLVGSPAIDSGDPAFDGTTFTPPLTNDQRGAGFVRVTKGLASSSAARIDIGAYELIEAPVFTNDDLEINTGSMPLDLSTASGVTPPGGTFSGTGVSGGFFDPTGLAPGAYTVAYTVGDANGTNSTDLTVTVTERPSLTVTSTSDTISKIDGQTTLREALAYAATLTGPQIVDFSDNTTGGAVNFHDAVSETILLGGSELEIVGNVTVDGPGADLLTIDGNAASRVFNLPGNDPANEIILRGLTVANGAALSGAGLEVSDGSLRVENCSFEDNVASSLGGAIESDAVTLDLIDTVFLNNEASEGGAIALDSGGICRRCHFEGNTSLEDGAAISFTDTEYVIADSTFTGNTAMDEGGVIDNNGDDLLLLNSTLSGNSAGTAGGAINNQGGLTIVNSTITGNRADADGLEQSPGTPDEGLGGGGIRTDDNRGVVTLYNTIVAGNRRGAPGSDAAADLSTALPADIGVDPASANNLIGDPGFVGELVHGVNGNIVGKENGAGPRIEWPLAEILNPVLSDNGGSTLTHALAIGSPAIDGGGNALAVDETTAPLATDQRGSGFFRITLGLATSSAATVDIGAYELFGVTFFTESDLRIAVDGAPVNLASATGVSPAGGVFSGPGVSGGFFDPKTQVPGVYTLTYTVTDAFGVSNSADFRVTVEALRSALTLTQPRRFETTVLGMSSRSQRVYLNNVGEMSAKTLRVEVSGRAKKDFIVTQPEARSLEAGESTFFQVTFRPRKDGNRKAFVTVYSDSTPVSVKLRGRGQSKSGIRPPRAVD